MNSISEIELAARQIGGEGGKAVANSGSGDAESNSGFIIVAVLFIIAALATLVGVFSLYAANTAVPMRVHEDRLRSEALITAAIELTALRFLGVDDETRPGSGAFSFQMGGADIAVAFRTEHARIDLNLASKALLSGLFRTLGAPPEDADYAADRIVGWRQKADPPSPNKEAEIYKTAGLNYEPRQAPFQNTAELGFVLGLSPALVKRALPFVTIFNGRAEIDVTEAPAEVVAALPNISPDVVGAILSERRSQDVRTVRDLLGVASANVSIGGPGAVRISIRVNLGSGRKVSAEVVMIVTDRGVDPYRILAWRDDFDGAF